MDTLLTYLLNEADADDKPAPDQKDNTDNTDSKDIDKDTTDGTQDEADNDADSDIPQEEDKDTPADESPDMGDDADSDSSDDSDNSSPPVNPLDDINDAQKKIFIADKFNEIAIILNSLDEFLNKLSIEINYNPKASSLIKSIKEKTLFSLSNIREIEEGNLLIFMSYNSLEKILNSYYKEIAILKDLLKIVINEIKVVEK